MYYFPFWNELELYRIHKNVTTCHSSNSFTIINLSPRKLAHQTIYGELCHHISRRLAYDDHQ